MPWNEVTKMSVKQEFVYLALQAIEPFSQLCKRFKISRKTGYKLLHRYQESGAEGLIEQSRRPANSPNKIGEEIETIILQLRQAKPYWGAKKIRAYLCAKGIKNLPATSTITNILSRQGLLLKSNAPRTIERFEHVAPNDLWQIDFKGHFAMQKGRCHPLTILDDHSRFSLALRACGEETTKVVKAKFIEVFEEFGLPYRMNFDNGTPWASVKSVSPRFTELSIWLMRLGIQVSFSRIRRPQTNGKLERFHRTLKKELLQYHYFWNLKEAQNHFDRWRIEYNYERPHEAIGLKTPISRYQVSKRLYPSILPEIEYSKGDTIRLVDVAGKISYQNKKIFVGQGFKRMPVAVREHDQGKLYIYFCDQKLLSIDLKSY